MLTRVLALFFLLLGTPAFADQVPNWNNPEIPHNIRQKLSQLDAHYEPFVVPGANATINVPPGYYHLHRSDARWVFEELWENPPDPTVLGMIIPESFNPYDYGAWALLISYADIGYLPESNIELFFNNNPFPLFRKFTQETSKNRKKLGFDAVAFRGFAQEPYYDPNEKRFFVGLDLDFEDYEGRTFNHDIIVLGREGVLLMRAIGDMEQFYQIQYDLDSLVQSAQFHEGFRYSDFGGIFDWESNLGIEEIYSDAVFAIPGYSGSFWWVFIIGLFFVGRFVLRGLKQS